MSVLLLNVTYMTIIFFLSYLKKNLMNHYIQNNPLVRNIYTILQIMGAGDHVINNKKVDPKKAKARHGKIFVGGLSTELSDDDIKNFFSQFGTVSIVSFLRVKYFQTSMNNGGIFENLADCRSRDAV